MAQIHWPSTNARRQTRQKIKFADHPGQLLEFGLDPLNGHMACLSPRFADDCAAGSKHRITPAKSSVETFSQRPDSRRGAGLLSMRVELAGANAYSESFLPPSMINWIVRAIPGF